VDKELVDQVIDVAQRVIASGAMLFEHHGTQHA
jgi:hypothetical protein